MIPCQQALDDLKVALAMQRRADAREATEGRRRADIILGWLLLHPPADWRLVHEILAGRQR